MAQTDDATAITIRFFHTIDVLRRKRMLRGLKTFTDKYSLNYWNMATLKKNPSLHNLRAEWLSYLVLDYGVSAKFLLTGIGTMFEDSKIENGYNSVEK